MPFLTRHFQLRFIALVDGYCGVGKVGLCQMTLENVHFYGIYLFIMAVPKSPQCQQTDYFPEAIWAEIGTYHEWLPQ